MALFVIYITPSPRAYFLAAAARAYLTAGTSSSKPNIGGSGPSGVMENGLICFPKLESRKNRGGWGWDNLPEYGIWYSAS